MAHIPHYDRTRRGAFDYRDRPCGRQVSWTVAWWSVALKSRWWISFRAGENVRTSILSSLAMIVKRHPGSVLSFGFYATSSLSFEFVSICAFSLYLLCSFLHFILFIFPSLVFSDFRILFSFLLSKKSFFFLWKIARAFIRRSFASEIFCNGISCADKRSKSIASRFWDRDNKNFNYISGNSK